MKTHIVALLLLIATRPVSAQQYITPPGLDKFAGLWEYINGQDTILLTCKVGYYNGGEIKIKAAKFYYTFKQGNVIIWNNSPNSTDNSMTDFGGSHPFGPNLDSMIVIGEDKLKRKTEEGYIIINSTGNQLTFKRDIGVNGGGLRHHTAGQGPLPGYTLPAEIILTKYVPPIVEMRKPQKYGLHREL